MKASLSEAAAALKKAESVLIFAHENPDGDALGSMIAAGLALKALCKRVDYRCGTDKSGFFPLFAESEKLNMPMQTRYDAALVLDCSTKEYAFDSDKMKACGMVIALDHHDTNSGYADLSYVEADSAATGEIVYNLIAELGVALTAQMADAVFLAMITDTGNFTYSNTTARTHRIAAELYERFDGLYEIAEYIKTVEPENVELLHVGLDNLCMYAGGRMVMSLLTYEGGFPPGLDCDSEILTNTVRYMRGVEMVVIVRQTGVDTYKISMRSAAEKYDVSAVAASFGGGGHTKAAGFNYKGDIDGLRDYFARYAEKNFV